MSFIRRVNHMISGCHTKPQTQTIGTQTENSEHLHFTEHKEQPAHTHLSEYINHELKDGMRSLFDFLIFSVVLKSQDTIKTTLGLENHPWTNFLVMGYLYRELSRTFNPIRDKSGLYKYLLHETHSPHDTLHDYSLFSKNTTPTTPGTPRAQTIEPPKKR
jgi:hypothetical protein